MNVVLAQMWHDNDHMNGGWWWLMGVGMLLVVVLVVVCVILLTRRAEPDRSTRGGALDGPEDILAARFARGEIEAEEYRQRRDALRER